MASGSTLTHLLFALAPNMTPPVACISPPPAMFARRVICSAQAAHRLGQQQTGGASHASGSRLPCITFGSRPSCVLQAAQDAEGSSTSSSEDELADAQVAVEEATSSGRIKEGSSGTLGSIFEVATLIFLAEWGDRSMLATIALGAAQVRGAATGVRMAVEYCACLACAGAVGCRMRARSGVAEAHARRSGLLPAETVSGLCGCRGSLHTLLLSPSLLSLACRTPSVLLLAPQRDMRQPQHLQWQVVRWLASTSARRL